MTIAELEKPVLPVSPPAPVTRKPKEKAKFPIDSRSVRLYREMLKLDENDLLPEELCELHIRVSSLTSGFGRLILGPPEHAFIVAMLEKLEEYKGELRQEMASLAETAILDACTKLLPEKIEQHFEPALDRIMSQPRTELSDDGEDEGADFANRWLLISNGTPVKVRANGHEAKGKYLGMDGGKLKVRLDGVTRGCRKFDPQDVSLIPVDTPDEGE